MAAAKSNIGVIGAGSWGTALAIQLARNGQNVYLWGRDAQQLQQMMQQQCNQRYLPDAIFPAGLQIEPDLNTLLAQCDDILVATPSQGFRDTLQQLKTVQQRVAWATKGFEHDTGKLPHEVAIEVLGSDRAVAVLSGPTFAGEVGANLPSAITLAGNEPAFTEDFASRLHGDNFRVYTTDDMSGVETGGAVKNVIAIGAGLADGLGFGANARAALITRGLAEMMRLGVALGAQAETFMGLAGMGDLVLTCTDNQSRNRRMGLGLASGKTAAEVAKQIGQVVEGVAAARAVRQRARSLGVEMPITEQIYQLLYHDLPPQTAVDNLMGRERKAE